MMFAEPFGFASDRMGGQQHYPYRREPWAYPRYMQQRGAHHPFDMYQHRNPGFGFYNSYEPELQEMDEDDEFDRPLRHPWYRHPRKVATGVRQQRSQKSSMQQRSRASPSNVEKPVPMKGFSQAQPPPQRLSASAVPATSGPTNSAAPPSSSSRGASPTANRDACFIGSRSVLEGQDHLIEEVDLSMVPPEHELSDSSTISSKSAYCYYDDDDSEVEDVWIEELPSQPCQSQEAPSNTEEATAAHFTRELELLAAVGLSDRSVVLPLLVEHFGEQGAESYPPDERQRKLQLVLSRLLLSSNPATAHS